MQFGTEVKLVSLHRPNKSTSLN